MVDIRLDKKEDSYMDQHGNCIHFLGGGDCNVRIMIEGNDNIIELGKGLVVSDQLNLQIRGDRHHIKINENVKFIGDCIINFMNEGMNLQIGEACIFNGIEIDGFGNSFISIGAKCTFSSNNIIYCHPFSKVLIGEDSMMSKDIIIQTGDGHTIFDLDEGKNINTDSRNVVDGYLYEITLGNHVWVGRRVYILGGRTEIGEGAVLGAQSLLKGNYPNNVVIAGDPARVLRKNIAWSRRPATVNIADCAGYIKRTVDIK